MKENKTIVSAAVAADENVEVTTTTATTAVTETTATATAKEATAEEKAKADVDAAQVVVDETKGDVDKAQAEVDEAQKDVDDAQGVVDAAQSAADEAQADATKAQADVDSAKTAVEDAKSDVSTIEDEKANLPERQAEADAEVADATAAVETATVNVDDAVTAQGVADEAVAAARAELEAAAQAASVVTTVVHSEDVVASEEGIRPADRTPVVYTGEEVVTIHLTDAQAAEVANDAYDRYSYTPNNEAVTRHALALINEIRALNGIPGVVTPEAMASTIAELRAKEMLRKDELSHVTTDPEVHRLGRIVTPDGIRYIGGENAFGLYNVGTYSKRGFGIMSDEELAYHLVLGWFSDYGNVFNASNTDITTEDGRKRVYGHAINLLSAHGHIGVAVAVTEPSSEGHFEGFRDNYGYASMNVTGTGEDSRTGTAQYNDFDVTLTNGVMELLYKGRPVKFIAKKTFNYVTTTTVTDTAEQRALDAHRVASATRIREAEEAAIRAQNALTAARTKLAATNTALATAEDALRVATADASTKSQELAAARQEAADAATRLTTAKSVEGAATSALTTSEGAAATAANRVATAKAELKAAEDALAAARSKRASLDADAVEDRLTAAVAAVTAAEQALTDAEQAKTDADTRLTTAVGQLDDAKAVLAEKTDVLTAAKARLSVAAAAHAAAVADRDAAAARLQALLDAQRAAEIRDTYTTIVNNGGQPVAVVGADGKLTYVAGAAGVTAAPTAKGEKTLPKTGEIASLTGLTGYAILSALGLVAVQKRRK